MTEIDINFDFRNDSICGDPDTDSPKLYENHKMLWSKNLPCTRVLNLETLTIGGKYGRIVLKNNLCDNLSSDRMCPHYVGKYNGKFDSWLSETEKEEFKHKARTIGGHIVFPAHKKGGFTINQARGVNRKICDRFDLTLECIRRFYIEEKSPLYDAISRYDDFFHLFKDFENYVNFFMLQDFVDETYQVKFSLPFDNFVRSPLPESIEEYKQYKTNTIDLIEKRNNRILKTHSR
ncbi:DUF6994 family protein [Vaginella massiliensis]|uniref:DUF6994 family protein n=1 Tax=Vaginella massiliensis TaxID=1816680 RepID=UPI000838DBEC|nr:hypothetical protein [Vaginella massiliensis]